MNNTLYNEIVEKVKEEFDFTRPSDFTDWNHVTCVDKVAMLQFAFKIIKQYGLKNTKLIAVFDKLNIDITQQGYKNKIRSNVYRHLTTIARPVPIPAGVQIPDCEQIELNYLENIDGSEYAKLNWFRQACQAGRQNEKKTKEDKDRGGYFSWGPQASRRDLEKHAIQFLSSKIKMPEICPITKCKLDYGDTPVSRGYDSSNQEHTKHRATLDRHDPTIGYTFENTFVVSEFGNRNKGTMTIEDVERLLEYMYSRQN